MTDFGSRLMKENNLSAHIESGDLYYNGTNTGESIYDFVLAQNDFNTKFVKEKLYYTDTFEDYLSEFLAGFNAEADAQLDTLTNKCIKYLFYRYNESLVFAGLELAFVVHTKVTAGEVVSENLQSRDWQYLVETIIEKAETKKDYFKKRLIKTGEDSEMLQSKNCKILRRVHNGLYKTVTENFKYYFDNLNETDLDEIEAYMVSNGLNSTKNVQNASELLMLFDYFYFINGRFPTTNEHTFVPRVNLSLEVNREELNIKKLYEKFRGSDSHGIVCSQFLAALFLFFNAGGEETARNFLSEFYGNMTVGALNTDYSFRFDAFTDLLTTLRFLFQQLATTQNETVKAKDIKTDQLLKQKYEIDDDNPPLPPYAGPVYVELDSISEKISCFDGEIAEPKLETPSDIKQEDTERKFDKAWLDIFFNGVKTTKQVLQELNHQASADLLSEEIMAPKADTEIDPIFIDDNDIFAKDDLIDKSNYNSILTSSDEEEDDRQDLIQTDLFNKDLIGEDTKTDYTPTFKPEPFFEVVPKEEKKEPYRRRAKTRAIQTLIKKRKKAIDNALLKNTTTQGNVDDENVDIDLRVTVPDNEDDVDFQTKQQVVKMIMMM